MFARGEMPTRQTFDPQAEHRQPLACKVDLTMFEGVFVAAADQERELAAISVEYLLEIQPVSLPLLVGDEA